MVAALFVLGERQMHQAGDSLLNDGRLVPEGRQQVGDTTGRLAVNVDGVVLLQRDQALAATCPGDVLVRVDVLGKIGQRTDGLTGHIVIVAAGQLDHRLNALISDLHAVRLRQGQRAHRGGTLALYLELGGETRRSQTVQHTCGDQLGPVLLTVCQATQSRHAQTQGVDIVGLGELNERRNATVVTYHGHEVRIRADVCNAERRVLANVNILRGEAVREDAHDTLVHHRGVVDLVGGQVAQTQQGLALGLQV
mmetsp:Transcript_47044/g.82169  ORF Transcript_47044/g.82169 Transcript_47044/m.82169 type:complete len:252 (+) Transcript_47044:2687-3442(+)